METIHIEVPTGQMEGLPIGAIVRVVVRGRVVGADERGPDTMGVQVEGEAQIQPGTLDDAANVAIKKLSNANAPPDFVMGQQELHAP
jgi:hypothetical protein